MEVKGLNVLQLVVRLKPDARSDLGKCNFGEANTHAISYVESDSNKETVTMTDLSRHHRKRQDQD